MTRKKVILCLGIDAFDDPSIKPLKGAAEDARAWAALFEHRMGYTATVLTHEDLKRGRRLLPTIRDLVEPLGEGDVFSLFVATHGKTLPLPPNGHMDQVFMLPWANRRALERGELDDESAIALGKLGAVSARKGVQRLFIIDACRSHLEVTPDERDGDEADFAFEAGPIFRDFAMRARAMGTLDSPLTTFHSCDDGQKAQELPNQRRGLFSVSAIAVLKNKLDRRQPLQADDTLAVEIGQHMAELASKLTLPTQHSPKREAQRPVFKGAGLRLYDESDRYGAETQRLLAEVEAQFAAGALDTPYGQCVRESVAQLEYLGLPNEQLLALRNRLQEAQYRRSDEANAAHDARLLRDAEEFNTDVVWQVAYTGGRGEALRERARKRLGELKDAAETARRREAEAVQVRRLAEERARVEAEEKAAAEAAAAATAATRRREQEQAAQAERDNRAWADARAGGTVASYRQYRERFPSGRYVGLAGEKIEELESAERRKAQQAAQSEAEARQRAAEQARAAAQADADAAERRRLDEMARQQALQDELARDDRAWADACGSDPVAAYKAYRNRHPQGRYTGKANDKTRVLEEEASEKVFRGAPVQNAAVAENAGQATTQRDSATSKRSDERWSEAPDILVYTLLLVFVVGLIGLASSMLFGRYVSALIFLCMVLIHLGAVADWWEDPPVLRWFAIAALVLLPYVAYVAWVEDVKFKL